MSTGPSRESFSEKAFYLAEFRGRTLAIAGPADELREAAPLAALLTELAANQTRVVLVSTEPGVLKELVRGDPIDAGSARLEGEVWRAFEHGHCVAILSDDSGGFARACREISLRLGLTKLMWIDPDGGVRREDGSRISFVDLEALRSLLRLRADDEKPHRRMLLREVELALAAGVHAINLSSLEGLADELFTYAGSGTLFTREGYVVVRALGLDDYDAAADLIARGVSEGYLVARASEDVERILLHGFGAFVEGSHLAGIGALLEHRSADAAEIASLYTLTRFLAEGIGGHLVRFALERARDRGFGSVFACTLSERVARFFERNGFVAADASELPEEKWKGYDLERRERLLCVRYPLR